MQGFGSMGLFIVIALVVIILFEAKKRKERLAKLKQAKTGPKKTNKASGVPVVLQSQVDIAVFKSAEGFRDRLLEIASENRKLFLGERLDSLKREVMGLEEPDDEAATSWCMKMASSFRTDNDVVVFASTMRHFAEVLGREQVFQRGMSMSDHTRIAEAKVELQTSFRPEDKQRAQENLDRVVEMINHQLSTPTRIPADPKAKYFDQLYPIVVGIYADKRFSNAPT